MKAIAMFLVLLFVGTIGVVNISGAYASSQYRWTGDVPTLVQSYALNPDPNECTGYRQDMRISELRRSQKVCVFGDERLKLGYFSDGGPYRGVVGFPYSSDMHLLEGICEDIPCRYSADQDMLVTQGSMGNVGWGVTVFKHVSERIKRVPSATSQYKYVFDSTSPDYSVANTSGDPLVVPSYAISSNGKWIVVELKDKGFAVINTDTFNGRQVTTIGARYGIGFDPSQQLAISNDGKSVAIAGLNAGFGVIDVVANCGQQLVGDLHRQAGVVDCPSSEAGMTNMFPSFRSAWQPRFFGDGQELEVTVVSMSDPSQRVALLAHGARPVHKLKLLALGDSFTSGEGETDSAYYEPGTNDRFDTCHVSKRSYPFLVGASMGVSIAGVKSVACSGAKIEDIIGASDMYWGQAKRLGDRGLLLSANQKTVAKEEVLNSFQPGRVLQSEFLQRYKPETIVVGIGGNDAGLMGKLKTCAMPGTCEWAKGEGIKATAGEIRRLHDRFVSMLLHISQQSLGAKIFVVGYPDFIERSGNCDVVTGLLIDEAEREYIHESISYLNLVIRAAAQKAGNTYVDIEHSLDGNKLCSTGQPAMNGLRLGDDISIVSALPMMKIIGAETFHPTPLGHSLVANAITSRYPQLAEEATCATDPSLCMPVSFDAPIYWNLLTGEADKETYAEEFAVSQSEPSKQVTIQTKERVFEPGSSVTVEIRSDSVRIGEFLADNNGSVGGLVTIPSTTGVGFHTLHLFGTNQEGRPIDVYQIIEVSRNDEVITTIQTKDVFMPNLTIQPHTNLDNSSESVSFDTADILGAHIDTSTNPPQARIQQPSEHRPSVNWIAIYTVAVVLVISLGALYLRRRWAKSSS